MKVLVTGAAGFIGFHAVRRLLARGDDVVGLDNLNDYYDPALKRARLDRIDAPDGRWEFRHADVTDAAALEDCFTVHRFDRIIHLAAQAGVRHSLENPLAYIDSNVVGFARLLEACRHGAIAHLTYASTSSVYGGNTRMPFSEADAADHPLQLYAATKRANELMAHSYAHLFGLPSTGLRFFTVYGPWGRPDMALFKFARAILRDEPIELYSGGQHTRDFTYVEDVVEGVLRASDQIATPDPLWNSDNPRSDRSNAPFRLYNLGRGAPATLNAYVEALETALGRRAIRRLLPPQPGDVPDTFADTRALADATGFAPQTSIADGVSRFAEWYLEHRALLERVL